MATNYIFLDLLQANTENIVVSDPEDVKTKDGTQICRSSIKYRNDRGVLCDMYFAGAEQFSFGVTEQWPFGLKKEDQTKDNIKTYQICYNLTDIRTVHNPTENEQYMLEIFDSIHKRVVEKAHEDKTLDMIPPGQSVLVRDARTRNLPHGGVKPIMVDGTKEFPPNSGKRVPDPDKSKRVYVKLLTSPKKDSKPVTVHTKFFGPGNKELDPHTLINVQGYLEPVFHIQSVYWGAHGRTAYGGSIQIRLSEANFTPRAARGPPRRMLRENKSNFEDEESVDDFDGNKETPSEQLLDIDLGKDEPEPEPEPEPKAPRRKVTRAKKRLSKKQ